MEPKTHKTMVQSLTLANFNYCPLVWYFTSAKQINKIEKIQEREFVSMEIKREQTLYTEIFKAFNDLNPPYMKEFFLQPQVI